MHARCGTDCLEIGYWIDQLQVGKGLATELAGGLVRVAFELRGAERFLGCPRVLRHPLDGLALPDHALGQVVRFRQQQTLLSGLGAKARAHAFGRDERIAQL